MNMNLLQNIYQKFWRVNLSLKVLKIDMATDIRQAAAMKPGGQGDRYEVWIRGIQSYLFFERSGALSGSNLGRWFVEAKAVRWDMEKQIDP